MALGFRTSLRQHSDNHPRDLHAYQCQNTPCDISSCQHRKPSSLAQIPSDLHLPVPGSGSSPVVTLLKVMASATLPPRAMHILSSSCSLVNRYCSRGRICANPSAAFVRGAMDTCNTGQLPQLTELQSSPYSSTGRAGRGLCIPIAKDRLVYRDMAKDSSVFSFLH